MVFIDRLVFSTTNLLAQDIHLTTNRLRTFTVVSINILPGIMYFIFMGHIVVNATNIIDIHGARVRGCTTGPRIEGSAVRCVLLLLTSRRRRANDGGRRGVPAVGA